MLKNVLKHFQMSEQNWGCLDKMSKVNFSPAETLPSQQFFNPSRVEPVLSSAQGHNYFAIKRDL